jgi:hypothetical protein
MRFFASLRMTYRALGGLSDALYREHLFFGADFVERILYSAKSFGFEGGEDSNRGYLVTRPVDYCMHQGHKICIFSSRPWR